MTASEYWKSFGVPSADWLAEQIHNWGLYRQQHPQEIDKEMRAAMVAHHQGKGLSAFEQAELWLRAEETTELALKGEKRNPERALHEFPSAMEGGQKMRTKLTRTSSPSSRYRGKWQKGEGSFWEGPAVGPSLEEERERMARERTAAEPCRHESLRFNATHSLTSRTGLCVECGAVVKF